MEYHAVGLSPDQLGPDIWVMPRGVRLHPLSVVSENGKRQRTYRFAIANDPVWVHFWVQTPLLNRAEAYLMLMLEPALAAPAAPEAEETTLWVGAAGPDAWPGYNYYQLGPTGRPLRVPTGTIRASRVVQNRLQFRFRLAREALGLDHTPIGFRLLAGDDGSYELRDRFPGGPGEPAASWALLHLATPAFGSQACPLTCREREILQAVADHGSSAEVADLLNLSRRTVERHLENIRLKLRKGTSLECVVEGMRQGWIG